MIAYVSVAAFAALSSTASSAVQPVEVANAPATRARPVGGLTVLMFSHEDYPQIALKRREQGNVLFEIGVDERGRVTSCTIVETSGSAALDLVTCEKARQRGKFAPARDASGRAVPDTYRSRVRWSLPGNNSPDETTAYWRVVLDAQAKPTECRVMVGGKVRTDDCARIWPVVQSAWVMMQGGPLPASATIGFVEQSQGMASGAVDQEVEEKGRVLAFDSKKVTFGPDGSVAECKFIRLVPADAKRRCFVPGGFKMAVGPNGPMVDYIRFGRTLWVR